MPCGGDASAACAREDARELRKQIRKGVKELRTGIGGARDYIKSIQKRVMMLEKVVERLEESIAGMEKEIAGFREGLGAVEKSTVRRKDVVKLKEELEENVNVLVKIRGKEPLAKLREPEGPPW